MSRLLEQLCFRGPSESGYLYLCPGCLQTRYLNEADKSILVGILLLIVGFLALLVVSQMWFFGVFVIAFLAASMIANGLRKRRLYSRGVSSYLERERTTAEEKSQLKSHEIYRDMLIEYIRIFGPAHGSVLLENEVQSYVETGLTREEAVRKLAEDKGYA